MQIPKMNGSIRFYFPDYPNHKLNGMMCWGTGKFEGDLNGLKCRKVAYGMDIKGNEFYITPDMFGEVDKVLVKKWHAEIGTEKFYLITSKETDIKMDPEEFKKMTPEQQKSWLEYLSQNKNRIGTI